MLFYRKPIIMAKELGFCIHNGSRQQSRAAKFKVESLHNVRCLYKMSV